MKSSLLKIGLMYFLVSIFVSVALAVAQWVLRLIYQKNERTPMLAKK